MRATAGRLEGAFDLVRRRRAGALLTYLSVVCPALKVTAELLLTAGRRGPAAVEPEFSCSDSVAPSFQRAPRSGGGLVDIFAIARQVRDGVFVAELTQGCP
ncbi:MAG: hypothetical protein JSU68_02145 [Phycisphaerales bacterium]|nr:MAG: hypothetical protein JSU68_02145 [Phycisphaerales bacterium]